MLGKHESSNLTAVPKYELCLSPIRKRTQTSTSLLQKISLSRYRYVGLPQTQLCSHRRLHRTLLSNDRKTSLSLMYSKPRTTLLFCACGERLTETNMKHKWIPSGLRKAMRLRTTTQSDQFLQAPGEIRSRSTFVRATSQFPTMLSSANK